MIFILPGILFCPAFCFVRHFVLSGIFLSTQVTLPRRYIDRYQIDYIVHGDDPCFTPDGRDVCVAPSPSLIRVAAVFCAFARADVPPLRVV
jgi:hypothetical protein